VATISASPSIDAATFEATGHLIPQVEIALKALSTVSSSVFLNLDASADVTVSAGASAQPCVTASTGLNVGVGAQASFLGIFDASTTESIFNQTFPLLQVRATPPHLFPLKLNK
jgi:hypothetical protein